MPVMVAAVQVQTVPIFREFVGQTSAKETVDLRARVGGFLEKYCFPGRGPGSDRADPV